MVGRTSMDVVDSRIKTLRNLLDLLLAKYPDLRSYLLDGYDELRQDVPIFVNGRNPRLTKAGINLQLEQDGVISIFSPISSGKMNVEVMREPIFGDKE